MRKTTTRIIASAMTLGLLATSAVGLAGCGKKIANDENTLEIFISDFGYGTAWLDDMIEKFQDQAWVKEKYPNLSIPKPASNSERTYPSDTIIAGSKANSVDLFFTCMSSAAYYDRTDSAGNSFFEDLTGVYESTVPGEGEITVAEKMLPTMLASKQHITTDDEMKYYAMPWVNGYMGLLYNETLMKSYLGESYQLPRTTNELLQMTTDIKGEGKVPFISASKVSYWTPIFQTWWMQYEGAASFDNYWNGVDKYGVYTPEIVLQTGRLRALQTLESMIGRTTGNNHPDVTTLEFTRAQSRFILGEAVMMPNGDWFENEMQATYEEDDNAYDIKFMRIPVISTIIEKCPSIANDNELSKIVETIDNGGDYAAAKAVVSALTEKDYKTIYEARHVMIGIDSHDAMIPSYATAKEVAKDFLRFMSTDIACESFMTSTSGASTAFNYDVETKNPTLYASFSNLQKERAEIMLTGITSTSMLTSKLVYWGGLTTFSQTSLLETLFTAQNEKDRKTAQQIYDDEYTYFTKNYNENWNAILTRAGVKN